MANRKDLTGLRFGKLVVKSFVEYRSNHSQWLCQCDCGNESIVRRDNLVTGRTESCGCTRGQQKPSLPNRAWHFSGKN